MRCMSVIPWGAALRLNGAREVEFRDNGGTWRLATGPKGEVTQAEFAYLRRDGFTHVDPQAVYDRVHDIFVDPKTSTLLSPTWEKNDFGRWGWNLRKNGKATGFYVHTTAKDEAATATARAVYLANSHGCVHLVPTERDMMIARGYPQTGVDFEVRGYTEKGPP
jgi:hypothetical protein